MTVASSSSGKLGSVNVDGLIKYRQKKGFPKQWFSVFIVDSCQRRSCIKKLATASQAGTYWALQPIRLALITSLESEISMSREQIKLSSSANVL